MNRQIGGVTFGGSGLDRVAHMRATPIADLAAAGLVLPLWRGKPLVQIASAHGAVSLVWLATDHPVLAHAGPERILLGQSDGDLRLAADISAWDPGDVDAEVLGAFLDATEQRHPEAPDGAVFRELRAMMTSLSRREAELAATARALCLWHQTHGFCARCGAKSHMVEAGWQRTCPACHSTHFPRTDPVVIMLVTDDNDVLLGRSPGWPEGMFSLLAGFVEPGETLEAAVRREVAEEVGVEIGPVSYIESQPWPFPASLMFGCSAKAMTRDLILDPNEIEEAVWVPKEDLVEVLGARHAHLRPARQGAIARHLLELWLCGQIG